MSIKSIAMLAVVGLSTFASIGAVSADTNNTTYGRYGVNLNIDYTNRPNEDQGEQYTSTGRIVRVRGVSDWSQDSGPLNVKKCVLDALFLSFNNFNFVFVEILCCYVNGAKVC